MKAIATNWKKLVTALAVGLALFFASVRFLAGRPSSAEPLTPATAPAADPAEGRPASNEVRDFPQQG